MSILTPILSSTNAFDATISHNFQFFVSPNSDQIVANRLVVQLASDNTEIYNEISTTFQYIHTLPQNSLTNNAQFYAYLTTFNSNNDESLSSNIILFSCYSTPIVQFTNLNPDQIINNSGYEFDLSYTQNEGEEVESYQIVLYDINNEQIATSGTLYDTLLKYSFTGLLDNVGYKIKADIVTVHGMIATTGYINFTVNYTTPIIASALILENLPNSGQIKISTNIINIVGTSNPDPPTYIDNEIIDLTQGEDYVQFDNGFNLNGDFTLKLWGLNFTNQEILCTLYGENDTEITKYRIEIQYFYDQIFVNVTVGSLKYHIYSDVISPTPLSSDVIFICLQRSGYFYNLIVENLGT